ncbi:SGNH/GDSL hydrolase family protein [Ruminococcus champanellensis]
MADPVTIREKLGQDAYAGLCAASLTLAGNNARLHRAFSAGQVRIAFLGGSVTAGCLDNAYVPEPFPLHGVQRLRSAMPGKRFYLYDYSIAGTGSDYGLVCVRRELSLCRPQLVVAEYGINDAKTPESIGCFESLIRMLLQLPEKPAVCLLLVGMEDGYCCRAHMTRIAAHYGLPVVDAAAALEDAIRGGQLTWWDYAADSCHPHPAGHQWLGDCLFAGLNEWLSAPADASQPLPPACAYHAPLTDLELLFLDALESPYEHRFGEDGLPMLLHTADHGGAWQLPLYCRGVLLVYRQYASHDYATFYASLDGGDPVPLRGYSLFGWGNPVTVLLSGGDTSGEHVLTLAPADCDRNLKFELVALGIWGGKRKESD